MEANISSQQIKNSVVISNQEPVETMRMVDLIGCPECGRSYLQKNIYRHLWNQHNWSKEECRQLITLIKSEKKMLNGCPGYSCGYCGASFKSVSLMLKHKKVCAATPADESNIDLNEISNPKNISPDEVIYVEDVEEEDVTIEAQIESQSSSQQMVETSSDPAPSNQQPPSSRESYNHSILNSDRHQTNEILTLGEFVMNQREKDLPTRYRGSTIACPECSEKLETSEDLVVHCQHKHENEARRFMIEHETFQNYHDFQKWFDQRQEDSCTSLTKRTGHGGETFYRCHRVGKYKSVANKRKSNPRKIDQSCTAFLKVFVQSDGTTYASGCFTHIGHELNHRLLWLTSTQENYVKELIDLGWTSEQIYYYIRKEYSDYDCKLKYITKNDIRNIGVRHEKMKQNNTILRIVEDRKVEKRKLEPTNEYQEREGDYPRKKLEKIPQNFLENEEEDHVNICKN